MDILKPGGNKTIPDNRYPIRSQNFFPSTQTLEKTLPLQCFIPRSGLDRGKNKLLNYDYGLLTIRARSKLTTTNKT